MNGTPIERRFSIINIFKKQNGMNIIGQGGKIILFMLPSLIAAIWERVSSYAHF